jgi:hypothetical protein
MQPDVLGGGTGNPQSLNRYAYSLNDPVNMTDRLGLDPAWLMDGIDYSGGWHYGAAGVYGGYHGDLNIVPIYKNLLNGWSDDPIEVTRLVGFYLLGDDFLIGQFGFSPNERARLKNAYEKITRQKCKDFFDQAVRDARKEGKVDEKGRITPYTLAGVLAITTLNKYSPNQTAKQVAYSESGWANVRNKFKDGSASNAQAAGVTLNDGRIFLNDAAFYQASAFWGFLGYRDADLAGIITHELFHRAGLNESTILSLHPQIQMNCGTSGLSMGR